MVLDIKHLMLSIRAHGIIVHFERIPSHCKIAGNEFANCFAKRATRKEKIDAKVPTSVSEFKREERLILLSDWQESWKNYKGNTILKDIKQEVNCHMTSWGAQPRSDKVIFRRL